MTWHKYFVQLATVVATRSKDPSTKVGCVLVGPDHEVLSTGFNGFPRGVREVINGLTDLDPVRWERPTKYLYVEHAERNAIYNAARHGVSLRGATAYMNFAPYPCTDCARALIQSGIHAIVGPNIPFPGKGAGTHYRVDEVTRTLLHEAGVRTMEIEL